ncbi:MAG: surface lipoprotein assembly modifier [Sulfitobacter sp.]|nr:surface lipoprotein assembly modifier [Sulfitobacter sp.]
MRQVLARTLVAVAVGWCSGFAAFSDSLELSPDGLRQAATIALREGDAARAQAYAEALLVRDPDDRNALLIRARALRDQGETGPARADARRAWGLAETEAQKFSAALVTAQILSSEGKRTRAQWWLRRAAQHAPNDRLRAKAKRDFSYVRARNPWSTHLDFVLAPNSNINNGSARDSSTLNYALTELMGLGQVEFQLPGSAQALSGLEVGAGLRSRYRFAQTETTAHDLKLGLSYRSFVLSDSAKAQAPGVSGADYAYGTLSLGYGIRQLNFDRRGEMAADIELGQSWYGGARYASFLRGSVQQRLRTSASRSYRYGAHLERQFGQRTVDLDRITLEAGLSEKLARGDLAYVGVSAEVTQSNDRTTEYQEVQLRGGYQLGRPVMGAEVRFGLGAAWRDYDFSMHAPDGRQDRQIFADVTATFTEIDYYGFNPSVTLSASRTDSNIGLYDTNRLGLRFGIDSAF